MRWLEGLPEGFGPPIGIAYGYDKEHRVSIAVQEMAGRQSNIRYVHDYPGQHAVERL